MDLKSFTQAIQQIADEKGIAKEKIIEAIEMALAAAYKRDYGERGQIIRATLDSDTGKVTMTQIKIVVDETMIKSEEEIEAEEAERQRKFTESASERQKDEKREEEAKEKESEESLGDGGGSLEKKVRFNSEKHMMIEEARAIKPDVALGDELEFPLATHEEYGRIAAQTAKQVVIQRIREVEREAVFDEYKNKEGEIVSGLIQRVEGRNVFVDIGRTVGILPFEEQIPYERYHVGSRLKALITLVEKNPRGPGVFLSRSHPRLLKKLFEIEVPEIAAETVEIKAIAREPGSRSKVAVTSHEAGVDPVGSLVGQKGIRVSTVISELGGEKIDIIEWAETPAEFVTNALSPARVLDVEVSERTREARAIVPEEQLSLAIGKGGQNVRLAAKLTGWKIDVRSSQKAKEGADEESGEENKEAEVSSEIHQEEVAIATPASNAEKAAETPREENVGVAGELAEKKTKKKKPAKNT